VEFVYTDGCNEAFIELCHMLDGFLNDIVGGEKNRAQYIQLNALDDIHDVIVAYDGSTPLGCASFKHFENDVAEVKRVFVRESHRGSGIARHLMDLLEQKAVEKGYRKLVLECGEPLMAAMNLYHEMGFNIIPNYGPYDNIPESICMEKCL